MNDQLAKIFISNPSNPQETNNVEVKHVQSNLKIKYDREYLSNIFISQTEKD